MEQKNFSKEEKHSMGKKFSIVPYLWIFKWHYLVGIIILLLVDMANLYIPQFTGEIIDGLTKGGMDIDGVAADFRQFHIHIIR